MKKISYPVRIMILFCIASMCSCTRTQDTGDTKDFNIILISIETLRADHLSCYGYDRNTSPAMDTIAKEGMLFTKAIASSPWTPPSVASIMTALYPISHGVRSGFIKSGKAYNQEVLSEEFTTLAELLKGKGYATFGAVANVHMARELGFDQGFDYYHCEGFDEASQLNDIIFRWKAKIRDSRKYFLWVHYFDPHHFYHARTPWFDEYSSGLKTENVQLSKMTMDELVALIPALKENKDLLSYLIALYDSEINYVDHHIEKLIKELAPDNNAMIIITSDHGEEFLDHGSLNHSHSLYQELIHVPLIIKMPLARHEQSFVGIYDQPASIIDIMPTILGQVGIDPPARAAGRDLLHNYTVSKEQEHNDLFSEVSKWKVLNAILRENWKYVYNTCTQQGELYNFAHDPQELNNLIHQESAIAAELKRDLYRWASASPPAPSIKKEVQLSDEIADQLKSLGYIDDGKQEALKPGTDGCNLGACHLTANQ